MQKIEGILFDLGDTLLDFGQVDLQGLFKQGARQAYEYLRQQDLAMPAFSKFRRRHMLAVRWSVLKSTITGREFNAKHVIGHLCKKLGLPLTEEQLIEVCWQWYAPLHYQAMVEKGLAEMLGDFSKAGLKLGVVSNTFIPGEALDRHLADENLLDLLPLRIYSCDIGRRKPNRSIFSKALEKMELPPEKVMFVGDSPRADIFGSNRMGMVSVLKDPTGRHGWSASKANHRIRSILELDNLISRYNDNGQQ